MRLLALVTLLLATRAAGEDCKPAAPGVIAAAERKAADAASRATQAESVAVRSGNPGAQARADGARADATAARDEVARLKCERVEAEKSRPMLRMPGRGY